MSVLTRNPLVLSLRSRFPHFFKVPPNKVNSPETACGNQRRASTGCRCSTELVKTSPNWSVTGRDELRITQLLLIETTIDVEVNYCDSLTLFATNTGMPQGAA
ncbi:hypothetical protein RRG08_017748 [Elysia crispata]|uniref:Uncharacterized protein n=1 Tax=Elysia crispata TaxID=231223 RepID=A0AAE0XSC2_9GAST|nr:hypothetical protein RRG08_017748 [Elysia crispata]